jgi:hypothetical protein
MRRSLNGGQVGETRFLEQDEFDMYQATAANHFSGEGLIIDAGCFTGYSTLALCLGATSVSGISLQPRSIVALDRFVATDLYIVENFLEHGVDIRYGESYLQAFLDRLASYRDFLDVRAGELTLVGRITSPIEILAIDIAKSPGLNNYIMRNWYSLLRPRHSIVIHQDFYAPTQPWIAASMGMLMDYFEVSVSKAGESASFMLKRPISADAIMKAALVIPNSRSTISALDRMSDFLPEAHAHPLTLMKSLIFKRLGDSRMALDLLHSVIDVWPTPEDKKWKKWLAMAIAAVDPSMFSSSKLLADAYFEHGFKKLGC